MYIYIYIYIYNTGRSVGRQNQGRRFFFTWMKTEHWPFSCLIGRLPIKLLAAAHMRVLHTHTHAHTVCHLHSLCVDKHTMCSKKNKKTEYGKMRVGYGCMGIYILLYSMCIEILVCSPLEMSTNNI